MASILLNDLDKCGCSSRPLDNCFAAAFWFGRGSSLHAQPITQFHQRQDTSSSAPWGAVEGGPALELGWGWGTMGWAWGHSEGGVRYSLWHFKVILPDASCRLEQALMLGLMCGLREMQPPLQAPTVLLGVWAVGGSRLGCVLALAFSGRCGLLGAVASEKTHLGVGGRLCARPTIPPVAALAHSLK